MLDRNARAQVQLIDDLLDLSRIMSGKLRLELRAISPRGERIPALALTAFARAEDRKRSLVSGYQAHLAKSFDVGELVLVIADLAGR